MIARGLLSTSHPLLAHLIVVRRCNLSCTYCNEYDTDSAPVPLATLAGRVDHLGRLGTAIVTVSGGEPLLHQELETVVRRVRSHGMLAGMITNGYLMTADRIRRLNRAGLDHLQISIDNLRPDDVSKKSLSVLDRKLQLLAKHADFQVNVNSVLGSGVRHPEDALVIARRALELGFTSTVGLIHDGRGQLRPLDERERTVFAALRRLTRRSYSRFDTYQEDMAEGRTTEWRCRAGGRYLYICENGLVHYCSQQRGYPGVPLENYTKADLRREFLQEKPCAASCTVSCVRKLSCLDAWRAPQTVNSPAWPLPEAQPALVEIRRPQR